MPTPLLALSFTLGTSVGVAAQSVINTHRFADTAAATTAFTESNEIISPADNTVAVVKVDHFGSEMVQVQVAIGTATNVNCLWALF